MMVVNPKEIIIFLVFFERLYILSSILLSTLIYQTNSTPLYGGYSDKNVALFYPSLPLRHLTFPWWYLDPI